MTTKLRLPDFIVGGAPRSGTTWLYRLLDLHPAIQMAKPEAPEPKFFLHDELFAQGIDYYSRTWFANAPDGRKLGEKSTNYLESPVAAARIQQCLPEVKLIFILREPFDRAVSNYLWSRMNGMESTDFASAIALEDERERGVPTELRFARPHAYYSRGLYADLLAPYFELFPRRQILVLRYEDILSNPEQLAVTLHEFLGVAARPQDAHALGVVNPSRRDNVLISAEARQVLRERYLEPNRRLAELVGPEFSMWETS